jgi:MYXO-CTERM domain-containing protein
MKSFVIASAAGVLAFAAGAQGAFFSFGADTLDQSWTFTGNGSSFSSATGNSPVLLHIDDNNGAMPRLSVSASLTAQVSLTFVGAVNLPGGAQALSYAANGSFVFTDVAAGVPLLTTNFSNALFTTRGSPNNFWATTASLQVDDGLGATVSMVWGGASLGSYGLLPGLLDASPRGFAFDMVALNTSGAMPYGGQSPGVPINGTSKLPTSQWFAESSFTAYGSVVPSPGSLALLGIGALAMRRRRRA